MTTTEMDTTIAELGVTLRALEQVHARQVGTLHKATFDDGTTQSVYVGYK